MMSLSAQSSVSSLGGSVVMITVVDSVLMLSMDASIAVLLSLTLMTSEAGTEIDGDEDVVEETEEGDDDGDRKSVV